MEAAREATQGDLDRLVELSEQAVDQQIEKRGGPLWSVRESRLRPHEETLTRDLRSDDARVVVGTYHGYVSGYASCVIESLRDETTLGVVTDIYVEPEFRAVGIGEEMMNQLVDWARDRGCIGVDSLALPGDRETKNFFETFGLKARALLVNHRFEDE